MAKTRRMSRRDRITFQQPVITKNSYGQDIATGYSNVPDLVSVHADFTHTGGTEVFRGRQIEAGVVGVFEIRMPRQTIDPRWRVLHLNKDNTPYEIVSARPTEGEYEGGDRFMWVFVKGLA